jgi:TonB family protein
MRLTRLVAVIMLLSTLVLGQQAALNEARQARQQGDLARAVEKYRQALAEAQGANGGPYTSLILPELAAVLEVQGDLRSAEQILVEAAKPDRLPGQLPALGNLLVFYRRQNRAADELEVYSRIIKQWSNAAGSKSIAVARYLAEKAKAEAAAGSAAQAEASFRESLAMLKELSADRTVFGYFVLATFGESLSALHKPAEAASALSESIDGLDGIMGKVPGTFAATIGPAFVSAYRARHPEQDAVTISQLGTVNAVQTSGRNPEYSDQARRAQVSGGVSIIFEVTEAGLPANIFVFRPLGLGLDEKATEAVREWRFRPATRNGMPVSTTMSADIVFRLS